MRRSTLLALSLTLAGIWPHDGANGQSSMAPPVSLAAPEASPPRTSATRSRVPPATSAREVSPPVVGGLPQAPNPGGDYDGFSVTEDNAAPGEVTPPARSRAAKEVRSNQDAGSSFDQEDEALKRKLTICQNCK
ncbi:hypothetical protein GPL17_07985 [Bradyrhizobium yuanmingense]|uniref:hypothetical protein n=1 Tax=Bradyrhizobium TaxID=374 RepID=UPI0012F77256|nr:MULTISPECIES: hypothetical protein [Bradyrhizobium]MDA9548500.1 hypothetical protein [Bradyrhizobium sp. CCBAU 45321]MDF0580243.1 hypothetical protein [Bradyrhizobium yuanmingense]MVT50432.1 hypothetical protein [Bradyrhizobium yuanmingense]